MTATFRLNQKVKTPNGDASFVGYLRDGLECQIARFASATEFSREECEGFKPAVRDMSRDEFTAWQKNASFLVNEIHPTAHITGA